MGGWVPDSTSSPSRASVTSVATEKVPKAGENGGWESLVPFPFHPRASRGFTRCEQTFMGGEDGLPNPRASASRGGAMSGFRGQY
jgi:hypothetical protein